MNNVVEQQKQSAIRDYGRSLPQLGSQAAALGGLGGTRSALMESEANRNLENNLAGIEATGRQGAYDAARNQFNQQNANLFQGANTLGNLGQQQFQQVAGINTALLGAGALQQQQQQTALNTGYQQYLNQQNYPYSQLGFMSSLIRGTPTTQSQAQLYQSPPTAAAQVAGMGLGLGSLFGALG
jgi:ABC-type transport system involved in Fe-S cluster assembly fused permease/ATPase subunit